MITWKDYAVQEEYYRDLRRQAEKEAFARQMMGVTRRKGLRLSRLLAWLGEQMVTWGLALQEHFTPEARDLTPSRTH